MVKTHRHHKKCPHLPSGNIATQEAHSYKEREQSAYPTVFLAKFSASIILMPLSVRQELPPMIIRTSAQVASDPTRDFAVVTELQS